MIEADILNTSRPWVEIELGPVGKRPFYRISTNQNDTGSFTNNGEFIQDGTALITAASIEGIVPAGRKGSFTIKDISGVWPERFGDIGRLGSDMSKAPGPNMYFSFGWQGLKPRNDYQGDRQFNSLTGFIENVKFDISDDGSININVEFVAYSSIAFSDIISFDWNDYIKSDPDDLWDKMTKIVGGDPTASQILNYVTCSGRIQNYNVEVISPNTSAEFSFSHALYKRRILLEFRTNGWEEQKLRGKNDLTSIEFGMSLSAWLNAMLAKVLLSKDAEKLADEKGLIVTYERKPDREVYLNGEIWTKIIYDWSVVSDPASEENSDNKQEIETNYSKWIKERDGRTKYNNGPVLFWKAGGEETYEFQSDQARVVKTTGLSYDGDSLGNSLIFPKRVLNWESDLNSYGHLFRMFKDQLAEKLGDLKQRENFDSFLDRMSKYESIEEMEAALSKEPTGLAAIGRSIGDFFNPSRIERRQEMADTLNTAIDIGEQATASNESGNAPVRDQTLSSILAQNTFKVTAEVMGDPDLGTIFQGGNTIITTDFTFGNEDGYLRKVYDQNGNLIDDVQESLISMFSRQWILLNTVHNFGEDGSYRTKITLQGYIPTITKEEAIKSRGDMWRPTI